MRNGSRGEEEDALPSCPMCRATWKEQPLLKSVSVRENLDSGVVQMYIDWLYSRTLVIPTEISRKSDTFNVVLLKCWAVAAAMGDEMFRDAVIETFFAEAKARLWSESVKWTFVDDCGVKEIKDFVMEVFLAFVEPEWFRKESATWPEVFVGEVGERLLEGGRRREFDEIQRRWLLETLDGEGQKGGELLKVGCYRAGTEKGDIKLLSPAEKRSVDEDEVEMLRTRKRAKAGNFPSLSRGKLAGRHYDG